MKKILFPLLILLQISVFGQDANVKYVSTIGSKIFLKDSVHYFSKYGAVKIASIEEKNKIIEILKKEVLYKEVYHKMMVNLLLLQLEKRDYSKEYLIIVYSPPTNNLEIDQPYYLEKGEDSLIFSIIESSKEEKEKYSSIRVYLYTEGKKNYQHYYIEKDMVELIPERL